MWAGRRPSLSFFYMQLAPQVPVATQLDEDALVKRQADQIDRFGNDRCRLTRGWLRGVGGPQQKERARGAAASRATWYARTILPAANLLARARMQPACGTRGITTNGLRCFTSRLRRHAPCGQVRLRGRPPRARPRRGVRFRLPRGADELEYTVLGAWLLRRARWRVLMRGSVEWLELRETCVRPKLLAPRNV